MKNCRLSLARLWTAAGCVSLMLSGFTALLITSAKVPGIKEWAKDLEFVRWCLVQHVNLGTLIWFSAIPLGWLHSRKELISERHQAMCYFGFGVAMASVLLMISTFPSFGRVPLMINYIPVILDWRYLIGLGGFMFGAIINHFALLDWNFEDLSEITGSLYFVAACVALLASYGQLDAGALDAKEFFETGMWASGHLFQHSSTAFLLAGWLTLSSTKSISKKQARFVFSLFLLPLVLVPYFLIGPSKEGFTLLMSWGIAPPAILLWIFLIHGRNWPREPAFNLSSALLLTGFVFGALIRGSDLRVPAHYHATIGAITLAFMASAASLLGAAAARRKWFNRALFSYGLGQILFSAGLFISGLYGIGRKTYGSEHDVHSLGQYLGMSVVAIGGAAAVAGGLLFFYTIWPCLFSATNSLERDTLSIGPYSSRTTPSFGQPLS